MENKKCLKCGGTKFSEGTDYMPIRKSKSSFKSSNKIYTFCIKRGEVESIRIENPSIFKQ